MIELGLGLSVGAFLAGVLMFFAPCTLPLVPAYLAFISGVKAEELQNPATVAWAKRRIIYNGCFFVLGFSVIFIVFGLLLGYLGSYIAEFRRILTPIGGGFIILFGLGMLGMVTIPALAREHRIKLPQVLKPGNPVAAFTIGSTFALGWSPCIGPVLATVLFLASARATALEGGVLLAIFSLGMAIPFLLTAALYSQVAPYFSSHAGLSKYISIIGGVLLIFIGILLVTGSFTLLIEYGYVVATFLGIEAFYNFL